MLDPDARLSEARVQPQREAHTNSASELPHLEKFPKCQDQTQGSMKPAFNKQIQIQADEAKTRRSSNSRLAYQCKSCIECQKHGHEPRVGGSVQKRLKS